MTSVKQRFSPNFRIVILFKTPGRIKQSFVCKDSNLLVLHKKLKLFFKSLKRYKIYKSEQIIFQKQIGLGVIFSWFIVCTILQVKLLFRKQDENAKLKGISFLICKSVHKLRACSDQFTIDFCSQHTKQTSLLHQHVIIV